MLAESENMSIYTKTAHIFWDDEEWNLVAAELKRQNPRRNTDSFTRLDFTAMEVEDAAEIVLEQDRQRSYDNFNIIRRPLFDAFQRMKKNGPPPVVIPEGKLTKGGHIAWSDEEYDAVINELYRLNPANVEDGCKTVTIVVIRQAMLVLEPHRRRSFKQLVTFRETITRMWARRPVTAKPVKKEAPKLVTKEFTTGVITEPPIKKSDEYHSVATALHAAFQAPVVVKQEPKKRKPNVSWSPADWVLIAREMRRQNPHINFFASKFAIIDLPAVREAQRAIFPIEHRKVLMGTHGLQIPLVDAFKALRLELDKEREEEDRAKLAEKVPVIAEVAPVEIAEVSTQPIESVLPKSVESPPTTVISAAPEYRDSTETDFITAVTNAAVPLMSLLISEITKSVAAAMIPQLTKAIQTALEGTKTAPMTITEPLASPVALVESVALAAPEMAPIAAPPIPTEPPPRMTAAEIAAFNNVLPKARKPKIAMLGPMGKQITDIEQAYPNYSFVFIQNGHGIKEAAIGCELFLAYTSHMNSHRKNDVKKHVPFEKLRRIEGSLSSIKHQIEVWESTKNGS